MLEIGITETWLDDRFIACDCIEDCTGEAEGGTEEGSVRDAITEDEMLSKERLAENRVVEV